MDIQGVGLEISIIKTIVPAAGKAAKLLAVTDERGDAALFTGRGVREIGVVIKGIIAVEDTPDRDPL